MSEPLQRKPILTEQAILGLRRAKLDMVNAASGKVPERLVLATAMAAVRLARGEDKPGKVLSKRVLRLVLASLKDLAQKSWKSETALLLQKRLSNHETHDSQE